MNIPELLAPAGSFEKLKIAVQCGADAVYLGYSSYSARAYAKNFSEEETKHAISFAHANKVKVYVAVNTILLNDEIGDFIEVITKLAEFGVDAFIVQDLAAVHLLRETIPEIPIHASTQMLIHNLEGVKQAEEWGIDRVILARETSLEDIKYIHQHSHIELETFVHGAQCVCYSGGCLFSSMEGGRSGNRGDCAQPCRKAYTLYDKSGRSYEAMGNHLLSPRDMDALLYLPDLIVAGVSSIKIEGRMKNEAYVAVATASYRWYLDQLKQENPVSHHELYEKQKKMASIFSRGGQFSSGFLMGDLGVDNMFFPTPKNLGIPLGNIISLDKEKVFVQLKEEVSLGDGYAVYDENYQAVAGGYVNQILDIDQQDIRKAQANQKVFIIMDTREVTKTHRIYKSYNHLLTKKILKYEHRTEKKALDFYMTVKLGKPIEVIVLTQDFEQINYTSDYIVEKSQGDGVNYIDIEGQLKRLGNTNYYLQQLELTLDDKVFVPKSVLNNLRREVIALLDEKVEVSDYEGEAVVISASDKKEKLFSVLDVIPPPVYYQKPIRFSVEVASLEQAEAAIESGCKRLILDMTPYRNHERLDEGDFAHLHKVCSDNDIDLTITWSRIANSDQVKGYEKKIRIIREIGIESILINNIGQIPLAKALGFEEWIAGIGLNITNDVAIKQLMESGFSYITLSPELSMDDMSAFSFIGNMKLSTVVYGDIPLMHTEYCALGSICGGKSKNRKKCSMPCLNNDFFLKMLDKNQEYKLITDETCRMHIYNGSSLDASNYIEDLKSLFLDEWLFLMKHKDAEGIKETLYRYGSLLEEGSLNANHSQRRAKNTGRLLEGVKRSHGEN